MEPTPVPRTPVSQRIGAAAAAESKEDAADAGATVHAQLDCVDTWSTDKIEITVASSGGLPHRPDVRRLGEAARAIYIYKR